MHRFSLLFTNRCDYFSGIPNSLPNPAQPPRSGHLASAAGGMVHICEFRIPMPMTVWALGLPPRTRSLVLARALALALLLGA